MSTSYGILITIRPFAYQLGMTPIPSFEAFHLRTGADYLFRVTPRNRYGWGSPSTTKIPITVRTKCTLPDFTLSLPTQVKVLRGDTLSLNVQVIILILVLIYFS